jgi:hypothetical protein
MVGFRHISVVLADMKLTTGELAARGHDGAHTMDESGGSPLTRDRDEPPMRSASEGVGSTRIGMRKKARAETRASSDRGGMRQTARRTAADTDEAHMRPVLRLVMGGRGMSTAHRRQLGVPAPAVLRPTLLVIEGGHATGPR